jgi:hypothetical protein
MEQLMQKVKNVIKQFILILWFTYFSGKLYSQEIVDDKTHENFQNLIQNFEDHEISIAVNMNDDWLIYLSDSINLQNGLKGACRIENINEVIKEFKIQEILLKNKKLDTLKFWDSEKLPRLNLIEKSNINYSQYSLPIIHGGWAIIRFLHFSGMKKTEDSIFIFQKKDDYWERVCRLIMEATYVSD